jgi:hypothetical protein
MSYRDEVKDVKGKIQVLVLRLYGEGSRKLLVV